MPSRKRKRRTRRRTSTGGFRDINKLTVGAGQAIIGAAVVSHFAAVAKDALP